VVSTDNHPPVHAANAFSELTTHQKRQNELRAQIEQLEAENVAKKDWTLMGEANARSRPQNSLLEEDLEFERVAKVVPVVTEEVIQRLEDRIKARILTGQFDDVVRQRAVEDKPFLPSRFFELQDSKSKHRWPRSTRTSTWRHRRVAPLATTATANCARSTKSSRQCGTTSATSSMRSAMHTSRQSRCGSLITVSVYVSLIYYSDTAESDHLHALERGSGEHGVCAPHHEGDRVHAGP
jgi:hypothetical protein